MANDHVLTINVDNFDAEVLKSDLPVFVDFWAAWCGPCRMVAPVVDEIAEDYQGRVKVGKVNVDEQPELTAKYGIQTIPTLILFKNSQPVDKVIGVVDKEHIEDILDKHI